MPQRRLNLDFAPAGSDDRDIVIGAFARKVRQRRRVFGWFGVALMGLAALLYFGLRPISESGNPRPIIAMRCSSCGFDERAAVPENDTFPLKCPRCLQRTLQSIWQCRKCQERFLPSKATDIVKCPKCGSDAVGNAVDKPSK